MAETKTKIKICDKEYNIVSTDSREHVHRVAAYLDDMLKELKDKNLDLGETQLLTLAALNVADELIKAQDRLDTITSEVEGLRGMARDMRIRKQVSESDENEHIKRLEAENALLKEQLEDRVRRVADLR